MRNVVCVHFHIHQSMDRKNSKILVKLFTGHFIEHTINGQRIKTKVSNLRIGFDSHVCLLLYFIRNSEMINYK